MSERAAGQSASGSPEEQELLQLEQQWADAIKSGDVSALQRIEADNYEWTSSDGTKLTKQDDIQGFKSGSAKYESLDLSDLKVHVDGDTATVTGKSTVKGTEKGTDLSGTYQFTDTFAKKNGQWQAVSTKSTKLPQQ